MPTRALRPAIGPLVGVIWLAVPVELPATDANPLLSQARAYREAGDLPQAATTLERLLVAVRNGEAAGTGPSVLHKELGEVYEILGRRRAAVEHYRESLSVDSEQRILHYRVGILYRQFSEHSKAVWHLSAAFDQGFRNTAVRYHLAAAQLADGRLAAGLDGAREILQQVPLSGELALRVGRLLFQFLFYRDAIQAFETALERSAELLEARVYLALTNHLLNHHARTVELLAPFAAPDGSANAELLSLLASALASLDRFGEAEELLRRAMAREPSSPHAYLNLALVLLEQEKTGAAEAVLGRMRWKTGTTSPKVFYGVQRNSCEAAYREVSGGSRDVGSDGDPERGLQLFEFARTLIARHHHGTAVELLRIAARDTADPDVPRSQLLRALATSCLNLQPVSEVPVLLLERAVELDPSDHRAHFLLGQAHQQGDRPRQAAEAFERAIRLMPDRAAYFTEFARLLISSEDALDAGGRAAAMLVRVIEIDPSHASARFELAKLRMRQGRLEDAAEQLRMAVDSEPEFYEPYYLLGQVSARQGMPVRASEYLRLFEAKKAAIEARSAIWKGSVSGADTE